jgi:hypothetical protein
MGLLESAIDFSNKDGLAFDNKNISNENIFSDQITESTVGKTSS